MKALDLKNKFGMEVLNLRNRVPEEFLLSDDRILHIQPHNYNFFHLLKELNKKDILKLETVISDKYANTIKWLFLFWIGTIGTIIAIMKLL